MPKIIITPLSGLDETIRVHKPSHVVTLLSPEHMIETPAGFPAAAHLRIGVNDVADISLGSDPPCSAHISSLLEFGRRWNADAPLVVHCWAGISRSTAAAYILMCDRLAAGRERDIAHALRSRAPHASPNRLMIRLADEALGREGRMIASVDAIGPGSMVAEGVPFALPLAFEIS